MATDGRHQHPTVTTGAFALPSAKGADVDEDLNTNLDLDVDPLAQISPFAAAFDLARIIAQDPFQHQPSHHSQMHMQHGPSHLQFDPSQYMLPFAQNRNSHHHHHAFSPAALASVHHHQHQILNQQHQTHNYSPSQMQQQSQSNCDQIQAFSFHSHASRLQQNLLQQEYARQMQQHQQPDLQINADPTHAMPSFAHPLPAEPGGSAITDNGAIGLAALVYAAPASLTTTTAELASLESLMGVPSTADAAVTSSSASSSKGIPASPAQLQMQTSIWPDARPSHQQLQQPLPTAFSMSSIAGIPATAVPPPQQQQQSQDQQQLMHPMSLPPLRPLEPLGVPSIMPCASLAPSPAPVLAGPLNGADPVATASNTHQTPPLNHDLACSLPDANNHLVSPLGAITSAAQGAVEPMSIPPLPPSLANQDWQQPQSLLENSTPTKQEPYQYDQQNKTATTPPEVSAGLTSMPTNTGLLPAQQTPSTHAAQNPSDPPSAKPLASSQPRSYKMLQPLDSDPSLAQKPDTPSSSKPPKVVAENVKIGKFSDQEHALFLEGLELYGREWNSVAKHMGTRDTVAIRSHAQKYFIKLFRDNIPLPKAVIASGAGYTLSGKPLDPYSAAARSYMKGRDIPLNIPSQSADGSILPLPRPPMSLIGGKVARGTDDGDVFGSASAAEPTSELHLSAISQPASPLDSPVGDQKQKQRGSRASQQRKRPRSSLASFSTGETSTMRMILPKTVAADSVSATPASKQEETKKRRRRVSSSAADKDDANYKMPRQAGRGGKRASMPQSGMSGVTDNNDDDDDDDDQDGNYNGIIGFGDCYDNDEDGMHTISTKRTEYAKSRPTRSAASRQSHTTGDYGNMDPMLGEDAHSMILCEHYIGKPGSDQPGAQPFRIFVHRRALVVMDIHAHLLSTEVIGFLAGTWDPVNRLLEITSALPCRSIEHGLAEDVRDRHYNVELDPASEVETRELAEKLQLCIVGWYHSHPTFPPDPSLIDLANQRNYQSLFRQRGGKSAEHANASRKPADDDLPVAGNLSMSMVSDTNVDESSVEAPSTTTTTTNDIAITATTAATTATSSNVAVPHAAKEPPAPTPRNIKMAEPFVGAIVGPYDPKLSQSVSAINWFYVGNGNLDRGEAKCLTYSIVEAEPRGYIEDTEIAKLNKLIFECGQRSDRVDFHSSWRSDRWEMRLDKLHLSLLGQMLGSLELVSNARPFASTGNSDATDASHHSAGAVSTSNVGSVNASDSRTSRAIGSNSTIVVGPPVGMHGPYQLVQSVMTEIAKWGKPGPIPATPVIELL